ncbi:MAG: amidohydrolase family protein, partial [Pseudomonadota bacterium]
MRHRARVALALLPGALLTLLAAPATADTLIHNVSGYTPLADGTTAHFVALRIADDGTVAATYAAEPDAAVEVDQRVDGRGATLLPGLIDAHAHVYSLGRLRTSIDLAGVPSLEEALGEVRQFADGAPG